MDRLDEALRIIKAMFAEDAPSFSGRHYRIDGAKNVPRPVRAGGPPILIGGDGEKRTLRLVAEHADMCNIHGGPDTIRHKLDVLTRHCKDVGRDVDEIATSWLGTLVLVDTPDEVKAVEALLEEVLGADFRERTIFGDADAVVEQVRARVDAGLDMLMLNMPNADAAAVRRAGELLTSAFS
jgi:alkanesulfonate monooxygenase SsuD/methylene tetrahydromethanopterin reductase-like flavin-dependent oxidoreductase (luciferase family)